MAEMSRREFVKIGAAGVAALGAARAYGANERVGLGYIGVGNRGGQLLEATLPIEGVDFVGVCDVYEPSRAKWGAELPGKPQQYNDYREMLENKDIDAVVIATPDHWHALQTIDACRAGKDVYIEKPLSMTIREGRRMVEVARETERVVTVGTHRRSSTHCQDLAKRIPAGEFGHITVGQCYRLSNMFPDGIGRAEPSDPPPGLDWNLWLGPRAERPFQANIAPYKFRWWQDYSSQTANWGVHYFDAIRWLLGEKAPVSVSAHGGNYAVKDDRTIPDTMFATFELPSGCLLLYGQYEANGAPVFPWGEFELRGTQATLRISTSAYKVYPEKGGQFQDSAPRCEAAEVDTKVGFDNLTTVHLRNFLDCVKSRQRPNADVEDGHLSTVFAHLANIALATKSRIEWDAEQERITNNEAANALLDYEHRKGFELG